MTVGSGRAGELLPVPAAEAGGGGLVPTLVGRGIHDDQLLGRARTAAPDLQGGLRRPEEQARGGVRAQPVGDLGPVGGLRGELGGEQYPVRRAVGGLGDVGRRTTRRPGGPRRGRGGWRPRAAAGGQRRRQQQHGHPGRRPPPYRHAASRCRGTRPGAGPPWSVGRRPGPPDLHHVTCPPPVRRRPAAPRRAGAAPDYPAGSAPAASTIRSTSAGPGTWTSNATPGSATSVVVTSVPALPGALSRIRSRRPSDPIHTS